MLEQVGRKYVRNVRSIVEHGTEDVHQIIRHQIN